MKISESGLIGADGRLRMPMERVNAFFAQNKGKRIVVRFEAVEQGSSAAQQAYYYNYIVPTIQAALFKQGERKSEKAVDIWLVEQYPGDKVDNGMGVVNYEFSVTEARQLTQPQMSDFLEWLKQYAAENLEVFIDDPRVI